MDVRLERWRGSAEEWNEVAVRCALAGQWRAARDCFERALILRGDLPELWVNLGVASAQLHDRDTARGAYEMARTFTSRPVTEEWSASTLPARLLHRFRDGPSATRQTVTCH